MPRRMLGQRLRVMRIEPCLIENVTHHKMDTRKLQSVVKLSLDPLTDLGFTFLSPNCDGLYCQSHEKRIPSLSSAPETNPNKLTNSHTNPPTPSPKQGNTT